jgi:TetR/AcrR family transcriptional repressor of nem operon
MDDGYHPYGQGNFGVGHIRVSQEEKQRSHRRIVESAARLLRERGLEGASVADVMNDAGLTHGGFYRHFDSKDDLTAAALDHAFAQNLSLLERPLPADEVAAAVAAFRARYLSAGHVASPGLGCPVAALAEDFARAPDALKTRFGEGVMRIVAHLARALSGSEAKRREQATRDLAMMVGAVMMARACDPRSAAAVLAACAPPAAPHSHPPQNPDRGRP